MSTPASWRHVHSHLAIVLLEMVRVSQSMMGRLSYEKSFAFFIDVPVGL